MMHAREDLACSFESLAVRELNTEALLPPARDLRPDILRPILQACREGKRVEIEYAPLKNPKPEYRVIQPVPLHQRPIKHHHPGQAVPAFLPPRDASGHGNWPK